MNAAAECTLVMEDAGILQRTAWAIAASDSSGGAGIQADLATFAHFKVHGCSILSKVTAQNLGGIVESYVLADAIFASQLDALAADLLPQAIKISVLGSENQVNYLSQFLATYTGFSVYDPIFSSSTKAILTDKQLSKTICQQLLPKISLITPNIAEAELLTNTKISSYSDFVHAGELLLQFGVKNVLIKGGHFAASTASDLFMSNTQHFYLVSKRQDFEYNVHGTGCRLSSAIAANIALGHNLPDALVIAKRYLNSALRACTLVHKAAKQYHIPQFSFEFVPSDMPVIIKNHVQLANSRQFPPSAPIGLYPVVSNSSWLTILAKSGIRTIQLRIKGRGLKEVEQEIIKSITIADTYGINLFINDYWFLAIKYKAYGIHLGQEDLVTADINKINAAGIRLGISTHSYSELAIALAYQPSYIALGPIFPTTSKIMACMAQGIDRLQEWQMLLAGNCQLVAIGGINVANIDRVVSAGVYNIALIAEITTSSDPVGITKELLHKIRRHKVA